MDLRKNLRHFLFRLVYAFLGCLAYSDLLFADGYDGSLIEAVRITLEREPSIAISKQQVLVEEGHVLSAQGVFDPTHYAGVIFQRSHTPLAGINSSVPISEIRADVTTYQAGLTQKLRSGITVNPALTVTRTSDNYLNTTAPSNANIALNFTLPLLKGRGEQVTTAFEKAALLNRDAAFQSEKHAISSSITKTVVAYWDYLAAAQALDIVRAAEERAKNLLSDAQKLAAGDEIAPGEVKKYEAKLLSGAGNRISAEQSLVEARSNLGLAMGLNGPEIMLIALPSDSFHLIDVTALGAISIHDMIIEFTAMVQNLRSDMISVDSRLHAAQTLLLVAADAQKPQLDLVLGVGYNGLTEYQQDPAALNALANNIRGLNASAGVNYSWPGNNRAAQGLVLQRSAELEQIQVERRALMNNILSSIEVRLNSLKSAVAQLKQIKAEIVIQRDVYENEKKKYRYGLTTLLDLFTSETLLTNVQLDEVNVQRNLAQALIRVRFETGTLLDQGTQIQNLNNLRLVTMPELAGIR